MEILILRCAGWRQEGTSATNVGGSGIMHKIALMRIVHHARGVATASRHVPPVNLNPIGQVWGIVASAIIKTGRVPRSEKSVVGKRELPQNPPVIPTSGGTGPPI